MLDALDAYETGDYIRGATIHDAVKARLSALPKPKALIPCKTRKTTTELREEREAYFQQILRGH